jgi:hypothetical protein
VTDEVTEADAKRLAEIEERYRVCSGINEWEWFDAGARKDVPWLLTALAAARAKLATLEAFLHAREMHPDYEYEETTGPRKNFDEHSPSGEGWERNHHQGRDGWERFEYHEAAYWMRRKPSPTPPAAPEGK